jgi:hypothetical protein
MDLRRLTASLSFINPMIYGFTSSSITDLTIWYVSKLIRNWVSQSYIVNYSGTGYLYFVYLGTASLKQVLDLIFMRYILHHIHSFLVLHHP